MPNVFRRLSTALQQRSSKNKWESGEPQPAAELPGEDREDDTTKLRRYLESQPEGLLISIGVFGSAGTGKTCLLTRLVHGVYFTEYDPTQEAIWPKNMRLHGRFCRVALSPANIKFDDNRVRPEALPNDYYIVTYNVGSRGTFDSLQSIHERVLAMRQLLNPPTSWKGGLVVATASDLCGQADAVSSQLGRDFAWSKGLDFFETSAKTGHGCTSDDLTAIVTNLLSQAANAAGSVGA